MSDGVSLSDFENDPPARDFRRANGAPMVRRLDDPSKWDRYSRPSGFGTDLDDESALVWWKIDRAMEGVACDPSIAATVAANIGILEGARERRERAIQRGRGEEAADIGTALHAMTHRVEANDGFVVPPQYAPDIAAYLTEKDRAGLESDFIEVQLCSDQWRAAGTADRIYRATRELLLPSGDRVQPGQLIIGDLKTGAKLSYSVPGYCIQMAIYCDSCLYDVTTNERSPLPDGLRTDWGLIVHMPVGQATCELLWCDLELGRLGASIVQAVRAWRKRDDFLVEFQPPEADDVAPIMDTPMHALELSTFHVDEQCEPAPPGWDEAMATFAQDRINVIGTLPEPRAMLLRKWPAGCPTLRQGGLDTAQLTTILSLLDSIEAAFSLPFPAGDPRPDWDRGLHKSELNRSNEPRATESEP